MVNVHLIDASGLSQTLQVPEGQSLMQAAVSAGVAGIVGECGGSAMCATCHVYVDEAFADQLPTPLDTELACWNAPPVIGCLTVAWLAKSNCRSFMRAWWCGYQIGNNKAFSPTNNW